MRRRSEKRLVQCNYCTVGSVHAGTPRLTLDVQDGDKSSRVVGRTERPERSERSNVVRPFARQRSRRRKVVPTPASLPRFRYIRSSSIRRACLAMRGLRSARGSSPCIGMPHFNLLRGNSFSRGGVHHATLRLSKDQWADGRIRDRRHRSR